MCRGVCVGCTCGGVLPERVSMDHVCRAHRSQMRIPDVLKLELKVVANHYLDSGN